MTKNFAVVYIKKKKLSQRHENKKENRNYLVLSNYRPMIVLFLFMSWDKLKVIQVQRAIKQKSSFIITACYPS